MYRQLLSVGGLTLVSRATGFFRDVMLGAVLGAGLLADAFYIAFRLPNHFRAIFGEGAFNAAYVPAYSRVLQSEGGAAARRFTSQIFTLLLGSQIVLLAAAWLFTPTLIAWLAPGLDADPVKFERALAMTRITFPYLLFITFVTLQSGTLNANGRFAAAAFAPVLLNVVMMGFLAVAFLFPDAGIAASWGVVVSGVAQFALTAVAAARAGLLERLAMPRLTTDLRRFFRALGPAVIGSAGVQIALFADTIIASMLPTGGLSSIYYADRLYQLPVGVIGIAAGTVLLPEMSRRLAAGDSGAALHAQSRTMALTVALAAPFAVAFVLIPEIIMRGVFLRGRFTAADAAASAAVLSAYGFGLLAVVLIRSAVASFQARGDTRTPMLVSLAAVAGNLALKVVLFRPLGAVGLAIATAAGSWFNLALLVGLAWRGGSMRLDAMFGRVLMASALAAAILALATLWMTDPLARLAGSAGAFTDIALLGALGLAGAILYGSVLLAGLRALAVPLLRRASLPAR